MDIDTRASKLVAEAGGDPHTLARSMVQMARKKAGLELVIKQVVERHPQLRAEVQAIIEAVQQTLGEQET